MKVLLIKNKLSDFPIDWDIERVKNFYKQKLDLSIEFVIKDMDIIYDTEPKVFALGVKGDALKNPPKEPGYDFIILAYNVMRLTKQANTTAFCEDKGYIYCEIPIYPFPANKNLAWISIAHEMLHGFHRILWKKGTLTIDDMDRYDKNQDPEAPDGNFARNLARIKPYIYHFKSIPKVTLKREGDDSTQTLGTLTFGSFTCKTLERPWKNNKPNISCIPKGIYTCTYTFSTKFMKWTYELKGVPGRSGIRIHTGNYFFEIQGCILLGRGYSDINKDKKIDVINSKVTVQEFESLLNKQDFTLNIM